MASTTPKLTPQHCQWWIEQLGEIARLETMRVEDVPRIERDENYYAAVDFDIELRARILAIQKAIDRECGR